MEHMVMKRLMPFFTPWLAEVVAEGDGEVEDEDEGVVVFPFVEVNA